MIVYKRKWEFHDSQCELKGVKNKERKHFFCYFLKLQNSIKYTLSYTKKHFDNLETLYSTVRFFDLTSTAGVEIGYIGHSKIVFCFMLSSDQIPECSNVRF